MLFAGNLIKQPAYINKNHRIISNLEQTNILMNNAFWIGVYPGINKEMREYILNIFKIFFSRY